ncbi:MAG: ThuA domain-containing protein [Planctomycetaceae bacterium]|nr:ThuA domain-containing protein [Planctomycetaceae bacterium]
MRRRELLLAAGAAAVGLSTFPLRYVAAAVKKKQKVLYFTRSAGFVHSVVDRHGQPLAYSEKILIRLGAKHGIDVTCSQDGAIFDGDLDQFDAFAFYTSGDLTSRGDQPQPGRPMSAEGKKQFLAAVAAGKGFVGIHAATDTFRAPGEAVDPYTAMIGAEFLTHQSQQTAMMKVAAPKFPGIAKLGDGFAMEEEWYTFRKFAPDLHVLLVQETGAMHDAPYQRPPYPATWARMEQKGRVFYTSMGHREDVWLNPKFQQVLIGGLHWALRNADADVTPNIAQVTPGANQLPK